MKQTFDIKEKYYYIAIPCGESKYRRIFVNNKGKLDIGGIEYKSEEEVKEMAYFLKENLTERMIKSSPIAWSW